MSTTPQRRLLDVSQIASHGNTRTTSQLLTIPAKINDKQLSAFIDSGCSGNLLHANFARHLNQIPSHIQLSFADGRVGNTTTTATAEIALFDQHGQPWKFTDTFVISSEIAFDIILGTPWLNRFNPTINWRTSSFKLEDRHFNKTASISDQHRPTDNIRQITTIPDLAKTVPSCFLSFSPSEQASTKRLKIEREESQDQDDPTNSTEETTAHGNPLTYFDNDKVPQPLDQRIDAKLQSMTKETRDDYRRLLQEFAPVIPDALPPVARLSSTAEHEIRLSTDAKPKSFPLYHMSETELTEMKRQTTELLAAGHIRHSQSPWGAPVLFVKKANGKLRMCIDYRYLNKATIKDATPLGRIDELRQRLRGAQHFTALDLMSGYHQLRIRSEDIPKTAFNTRYGHYEWVVMPFGLCNAPATFQRWINQVLGDLLDTCVIAYLDDILIYSKDATEHLQHLRTVLTRLQDAGAILNLEKSHFNQTSVNYLGHVVSAKGISIRPDHVTAILAWPHIKDRHDIQSFCGLANYFKDWIPDYGNLMRPLTDLLRKDMPFSWSTACETAKTTIQKAIVSAPVLEFFDPHKQTTIYSDASAYAVGGWIGQRDPRDPTATDKPVLYWSRKCKPAETRYGTHERELLGLLEMTRIGRPYIEGRPVIAKTDHQALKWLQTQPLLSRRQAAWVERLQRLDLTIEYLPGKFNTLADILSRRPDYAPNCPKCSTKICLNAVTLSSSHTRLTDRIRAGLPHDDFARTRTTMLQSTGGATKDTAADIHDYRLDDDGLLYYKDRLYIPNHETLRFEIIQSVHDRIHTGTTRTIDALLREFYWQGCGKDVQKWIASCDSCQRHKARNRQVGRLRPLPVPDRRIADYAMDFFHPPSRSNGYDNILLVIDRVRKYLTLIPCSTRDTAERIGHRFLEHVVRYQGLPRSIVVDRDSKWTGRFWTALASRLNIKMQPTTARHQQANGLAESGVNIIKTALRTILGSKPVDWLEQLPMIELAYNATPHTTTGFSPFELTFGQQVSLSALEHPTTTTDVPAAEELADKLKVILARARKNIEAAQDTQAKNYNKSRREQEIQKDQLVLIERDGINLKETDLSPKYRSKYIGPFRVLEILENDNFRLQLPPTLKIHDCFHTSILRPYVAPTSIPIPRTIQRPEPTEANEDTMTFEVDEIIAEETRRGKKWYLIRWTGYDESENSWEPASHLKDAKEALQEFRKRNRRRP